MCIFQAKRLNALRAFRRGVRGGATATVTDGDGDGRTDGEEDGGKNTANKERAHTEEQRSTTTKDICGARGANFYEVVLVAIFPLVPKCFGQFTVKFIFPSVNGSG